MIGRTLSRYSISHKLGEGGMGVVYRAVDTRLNRPVALKLLRAEVVGDLDRKRRFTQEAQAASALNHSGIVTIYDIDSVDGVDFIAMECVEGRTLDQVLAAGPLPVATALEYAIQITGALAAAHAAGIVHRDIKPGNLMVTPSGVVKVLDFGLAKLHDHTASDEAQPTMTVQVAQTDRGVVLGTVAYMSPEQAEGHAVDARSDIFSVGAVIYEMVVGARPFQGDSRLSTLSAILRDEPTPLTTGRPDAPQELERIVDRCLEKKRDGRYASANELRADLVALHAQRERRAGAVRAPFTNRGVVAALVATFGVLAAGAAWYYERTSRERWVTQTAIPEIQRLTNEENYTQAFRLVREAERYLPAHRDLASLKEQVTYPLTIRSTPSGADVYVRAYGATDGDYEHLGVSPVNNARVPRYPGLRVKVTKPGYSPIEAQNLAFEYEFVLHPVASTPEGMVWVPGGQQQFQGVSVSFGGYWLDKFEVTNRAYKQFVEAGGYRRRELWTHPFVDEDGQTLTWDDAIARFRDTTGLPGPSAWELGSYPEGQADHPVRGVSWYEAGAYAEFAGKSLPTVFHWRRAAPTDVVAQEIAQHSNLAGQGPAPVGRYQGVGGYGTFDMAGNVKEWCFNETGRKRFLLGGAWTDALYAYGQVDAQSPMRRLPTHGFRCARYDGSVVEAATRTFEVPSRRPDAPRPVNDDVFVALRGAYRYDTRELASKVESTDDAGQYWRLERVSYTAAYGNERVPAFVLLPKNAAPPFQAVIYFPGADAFMLTSSRYAPLQQVYVTDFIVRSGRALVFPVYYDAYERRSAPSPAGSAAERDRLIRQAQDVSRTVDYLETRPDIDRARIAYYGFSAGASPAPVFMAMEPRLRTAILLSGGFTNLRRNPEIDHLHFAPRVTIPTLMINGRDDFAIPLERAQRLFHLFATPPEHKRHAVVDGGHFVARQDLIREILPWLDKYLGPVTQR